MHKHKLYLIALWLLLLLFPVVVVFFTQYRGETVGMSDPENPGQVALGKDMYSLHCASCHGENLEGESDWRTRKSTGRLPAPPHDETGHTWHHSDSILFEITKYGYDDIVSGGYQTDMLVFDGVLSDEKIWAVLTYIKSTWPEDIQLRQRQLNSR